MRRLPHDILFDSGHFKDDLGRKSVRGGVTTMTAQGLHFVLQLVRTIVLARLLTPADYGLVGMVLIIISFATLFRDAGLSMATVQKENISHEQISTLFWVNTLIGTGLSLAILAGAPCVSWFYGRRELTAITAVLAVSFIPCGMTIQHMALLRRHLRFGTLAVIKIGTYTADLIVTILLALAGLRYWALVAGALVTEGTAALLAFCFCPWVPGRLRRGTGVRGMLKFGGHMTSANVVNFLSSNLAVVLIGRFMGAAATGIYGRAYQLFLLPISQVADPVADVAMPVLSSLTGQPERYPKYYQQLLNALASMTIPLAVYCALEADFLVRVFLGQQWLESIPVFQVLALAGLIQPVTGTLGLIALSFGLSARYFYWSVFNCLLFVPAFLVGIKFGVIGMAVAYTAVSYAQVLPSIFYYCRGTPVTPALFLRTLVPALALSAGAALTILPLRNAHVLSWGSRHLLSLIVFAGVYIGVSCCRRTVREAVGLFFKGLPTAARSPVS
jgi:PST family polysaccharide transporter